MSWNRTKMLLASVAFSLLLWAPASADEMKLAVTTSFHNSGLSDILIPEIRKDLGLEVQLIVVGTGQALRLGKAGDVDAVLVHSKTAEEAFVDDGYGISRREIMYNDFIIIGPSGDRADVANARDAASALKKIKTDQAVFVSRGDDSGTHRKELKLWADAGFDPRAFVPAWYRSSGSGMGTTLNIAAGIDAYVFSDRATWLKFANKRNLKLLYWGDPALFNQYAFLRLNPEMHPYVKHKAATDLENWLTGEKGQAMIEAYEVSGEKLFVPNAKMEN